MQLKTLIILGVITIISVGMAFILISKGYVRVGKPGNEAVAPKAEIDVVNPPAAAEPEPEEEAETDKETEKEYEETSNTANLVVISLEPIIVNLKGSFGRRYLKVAVNLGVEGEKEVEGDATDKDKKKKDKYAKEEVKISGGKTQGVIEGKLVEIRDILISVLSTKSIDDVEGWADQDIIRDEIKDILNKDLGLDNLIKKVFFTEFVIQ